MSTELPVNCSCGCGLADLHAKAVNDAIFNEAELIRTRAERDEALVLLRELVELDAKWDDDRFLSDDQLPGRWRGAWKRARDLVRHTSQGDTQ